MDSRKKRVDAPEELGFFLHGVRAVEPLLDQLVGEALLENIRLAKVLQVRARLLAGDQRDLVLSFARESMRPSSQNDRIGP